MPHRLVLLLLVIFALLCTTATELEDRERASVSKTSPDGSELIAGGINELVKKKEVKHSSGSEQGNKQNVVEEEGDDKPPRTATGGVINTLLVVLCFLAFGGNLIFLVHVFYLKEKVIPLKLVHNMNAEPRSHQL